MYVCEDGYEFFTAPPAFICPITADCFMDPVFAADGHTYDRSGIAKWLENHDTSPITREVLPDKTLRPNYHLNSQVHAWRDDERAEAVEQLKALLALVLDGEESMVALPQMKRLRISLENGTEGPLCPELEHPLHILEAWGEAMVRRLSRQLNEANSREQVRTTQISSTRDKVTSREAELEEAKRSVGNIESQLKQERSDAEKLLELMAHERAELVATRKKLEHAVGCKLDEQDEEEEENDDGSVLLLKGHLSLQLELTTKLTMAAAELGNACAEAICIIQGWRTNGKDSTTSPSAFARLLALANDGHMIAQSKVGFYYTMGKGVEMDEAKAVEWYRKAADQGCSRAQNNLGLCYENGKGAEMDNVKAVEYYGKAAEEGHSRAQNNLGLCYENGKGVEMDEAKAVEWYRKAAAQGHSGAQNNLGLCYENGKGVEMNKAKAVEWYRKAADQGHSGT